jgi:hypothetical protein
MDDRSAGDRDKFDHQNDTKRTFSNRLSQADNADLGEFPRSLFVQQDSIQMPSIWVKATGATNYTFFSQTVAAEASSSPPKVHGADKATTTLKEEIGDFVVHPGGRSEGDRSGVPDHLLQGRLPERVGINWMPTRNRF